MGILIRIVFGIVVGAIVAGLLEWLTAMPHDLAVLIGIAAGVIAYWHTPNSWYTHDRL